MTHPTPLPIPPRGCIFLLTTNGCADSEMATVSEGAALSWTMVREAVTPMLPPKAWEAISPELYISFWTYSLYDIYNPQERYG